MTIYIGYISALFVAPLLGNVLCRFITPKKTGQSEEHLSKQMLASMSLLVFFASVLALPMPFMKSISTLIVAFALLTFLLGGILPLLSSAILLTVKENERMIANSLSTTITLLLGLLPSSFTYGLLNHLLQNYQSSTTVPMTVTLYATVFSSSLLMIGLVVSLKTKTAKQDSNLRERSLTQTILMDTGVKGQRKELLIAKREPLLMYSHSSSNDNDINGGDGDSESCNNSSFCSHKDYD